MSEWKEVKLEDILIIYDKKRRPLSSIQRSSFQGQYRYYGAQGIIDYIADYIFDGEYMLIAEDGENLNSRTQPIAQIVNGKFWVNNHAHIVRTNEKANMYLVMLILNNMNISSYVTGAAQPKLNQDNLKRISIYLPDKNEQDIIAGILSSLDEKIETNNKLNEKLEEIAQAIFKSWFVDFEPFKNQPFHKTELGMIPEGWEVVSLDELTSKFGTGLNPRKNFVLGHGNNYYVTIKNMNNNRIYLDDKCDKVDDEALLKINARSKLKKGDLLFSGIGTIGRVAMVNEEPKNWNTSESVFNMHPSELCTSEFLYVLLLSDVFQKFVKMNALGAVQQGIRMASLKSYTIAIPEKKVMLSFCSIIKPIVDYIQSNNEENDRLASLRDTLLPRLMSGEIKI